MKKFLLYSIVVISGAILLGFYQQNVKEITPEEFLRKKYGY